MLPDMDDRPGGIRCSPEGLLDLSFLCLKLFGQRLPLTLHFPVQVFQFLDPVGVS